MTRYAVFFIEIAMDMELFSLHSADGTQIILTATYESTVSSARGNNLDPVMVH